MTARDTLMTALDSRRAELGGLEEPERTPAQAQLDAAAQFIAAADRWEDIQVERKAAESQQAG